MEIKDTLRVNAMIELPHKAVKINKKLKQLFGGIPTTYRVVFSENEFEKRLGEFNLFSGSIYLRTEKTCKECLKYPYIKSKFLIEKFTSPNMIRVKELPESNNGSYEPLYVFEDKDGNFLEPNLKAAIMVCHANQNPVGYWERKAQLDKEEQDEQKREYEAVYFGRDESNITHALHFGEAIVVPDLSELTQIIIPTKEIIT